MARNPKNQAKVDLLSPDLRKQNLWRCNCGDHGKNRNPEYHLEGCLYLRWSKQEEGKYAMVQDTDNASS